MMVHSGPQLRPKVHRGSTHRQAALSPFKLNSMNTFLKNNRLKIQFALAAAVAMSMAAVVLFQSHLLHYAWSKLALVAIVLVGTWSYLSIRTGRNGKKIAYFRAYREAITVSTTSFLFFGLFLFGFLRWAAPADFLGTVTPAEVAVGTILGGAFLSTIISLLVVPQFRRVNPENGMEA